MADPLPSARVARTSVVASFALAGVPDYLLGRGRVSRRVVVLVGLFVAYLAVEVAVFTTF